MDQLKVVVINCWCIERYSTSAGIDYNKSGGLTFNVTIYEEMQSSLFEMDIFDNMIQDGKKNLTITIRLISTCLPITIKSDTTNVTIIDDEGIAIALILIFILVA